MPEVARETPSPHRGSARSVIGVKFELAQLQMRYEALRAPDAGRDAQLMASLGLYGQQSPLSVVRAGEPSGGEPSYVLIDGYRRAHALLLLTEDLAEITVLELSEAEALIHTHRVDGGAQRTALEDGWLLTELMEQHELDQQRLAVRLDRSHSWVCRRLALVTTLPSDVQAAVRKGLVPAHAAQKYLVPLARANRTHASLLVANLGSPPVTVREMECLYRGYKCADTEARIRIVKEPRLFLRAQAAVREPDGSPTQRFIADLDMLAAICWRSVRRLREGQVRRGGRRVARVVVEARQAFAALCAEYEEESEHAKSNDTKRGPPPQEPGSRDARDRQGGGCQPQRGQGGAA